MKNRMIRAFTAMCLASVLLAGMTVTASASEPDYSKEIEAMSKWLDSLTLTPSLEITTPVEPSGSGAAAETPKLLTDDELKDYACNVFELVNSEREKAGITSLVYREDVAEAALIRATEIIKSYTHTRPDNSKYSTVFDELEINKGASGENIYTSPITPESAVKGWMDSEGHRNNILKEMYTATGVGLYQDKDGGLHWVQLFIQEK